MKVIRYSASATKSLRRMQPKQARAIVGKINDYAAGDMVDVTQLSGGEGIRIRVGQHRVIIDENGSIINVVKIAVRGSVY